MAQDADPRVSAAHRGWYRTHQEAEEARRRYLDFKALQSSNEALYYLTADNRTYPNPVTIIDTEVLDRLREGVQERSQEGPPLIRCYYCDHGFTHEEDRDEHETACREKG